MKKYTPSVKNNNQIKDEIAKEMKAFLYKIEKGKCGKNLDKEAVKEVYDALNASCGSLDGIIFTGSEDIASVSDKISASLKTVKTALDGDYSNRLTEAADELLYYFDSFKAIADGDIDFIDEEKEKESKLSWSKRKLYGRLEELKDIKSTFAAQEKRLGAEIAGLEKDLAELDDKMLSEDNERLINDLYRKISAAKSKLDMLTVRKNNYSACFNVLDIIYANANEILTASKFSVEEASKAKVLLNINKLKAVVNDPDKAIAILKAMNKDIVEISNKVKNMDDKVFGLDTKQTSVIESALSYKEELMRKKREKELNKENLNDLIKGTAAATDVKGEN